jgi:hypothetical protein
VSDSLALMRECRLDSRFYVGGVTYGSFPLLLAGFPQSAIDTYDDHERRYVERRSDPSILGFDAAAAAGVEGVDVLIVGEVSDRRAAVEALQAGGWRLQQSVAAGAGRIGLDVLGRPGFEALDACLGSRRLPSPS